MILSAETAQSILNYEPETWLRDRIDELASKANEGELTEQEQSEYEGFVRANNFAAILQAKARDISPDAIE